MNKEYKSKEVARILQEIFPDKKIEDNLSFLTFYKKYWKVQGRRYSANDLILTAALVLCSDVGISPMYISEVLKIKKAKKNGRETKAS